MLHFSPLMAYIIYGNFIAPFLQGGNSTQCAVIAFAQFSYFLLYTSFYSFCYTQHTKGFRFHYQQHIKSFFESIRRRSNNEKKKTATTKTEIAKDRITCWRKAHSRVGVVIVAVSTFHKKNMAKGRGRSSSATPVRRLWERLETLFLHIKVSHSVQREKNAIKN